MADIFFYEAFSEEVEALKRYLSQGISAEFVKETIQESKHSQAPAPLISIRTQSEFPSTWAGELSGILARSTGYRHLQSYLKVSGRKIPCGYLPKYCSRAVAEQALLLWMALLRKLPRQRENFKNFYRDGLTGEECAGKVLLVAGVGNIGGEIVKLGEALGMKVLGVDIEKKYSEVNYVSLSEGLSRADIIVAAMNLTSCNKGYFSYQLLKEVKPGAIFVNVARGELVSSGDLLKLLEEGRLGGVALDVYSQENELAESLRNASSSTNLEVQATLKLGKHPAVIFTPHNAFNTREALERKAEHSSQQVNYFQKHGRFLWPIPEK